MEHSETPVATPPVTLFSLGEAAKEVGKSKTTISRAIKSGKISAEGNGDAGYQIQPCELFRVFKRVTPTQPLHSGEVDVPLPQMTRGETLMLQAQLEAKTRECEFLEEHFNETRRLLERQLEDTRSERDKWQQQTQSTQLLLEHRPAVEKATKRSYWHSVIIGFLTVISIALLMDRFGGFTTLLELIEPLI